MSRLSSRGRACGILSVLLGLFLSPCSSLLGEDRIEVVQVEEDWELVVGTPDPNSTAPQVSCSLLAGEDDSGWYAVFEVNHQSLPEFVPGGMQLQIWNGEQLIVTRKFPNPAIMSTPNEVVRWTHVMSCANGALTFEIVRGTSVTWGNFGGQGYLKYSIPTSLTNLNAYQPSASVAHSAVGFAGNRVPSLTLKCVRYVLSNGLVVEDSTERVVHSLSP